jgi:hypothetical protein
MQLERYGMFVLMALLWAGIFDKFLYAARSQVMDWMFAWTEFAYYGVQNLMR